MTLPWPLYGQILECKRLNYSIRACAEELGISRQTVKKYWDGGATPDDRKPSEVPESPLTKLVKEFAQKYKEDTKDDYSGKHSLAVADVGRALMEIGISIPNATLYRHVSDILKDPPQTYIRLSFDPGEVIQVDWFETKIVVEDVPLSLPVFLAVMANSNKYFPMVMPNMKFDSFIRGHVEAFKFFGGVTEKIFYDNLKTAVKCGVGANAIKNDNFKKFSTHYGCEAVFMNACKGNEKGVVEQTVSTCRRLLFTPIKHVINLEEFHEENIAKLIVHFNNHKVLKSKTTIEEDANNEKNYLRPLPAKDYIPTEGRLCRVNQFSTVYFESTEYSVPEEYRCKDVTILWDPYNITIWHKGSKIAAHKRSLDKNNRILDPHHYFETLSNKIRSRNNAEVLQTGILSREIEKFVSIYNKRDKGNIVFKLLEFEKKYGEEAVSDEIVKANLIKDHSLTNLKIKLAQNHTPICGYQTEDEVAALAEKVCVKVPLDSLANYDSLITKANAPLPATCGDRSEEGGGEEEKDDDE